MTSPLDSTYDLAIIGGGIVGLATAYCHLKRYPGTRLVLLEKEGEIAQHQSSHNSGVLHSGIYYPPGSLRAKTCRSGKALMEAFCRAEGIAFERCGKVIVATRNEELGRLQAIEERGRANGIDCRLIDGSELRAIEPHVAGIQALHVPGTGIVDYAVVCERLARKIEQAGGVIALNSEVVGLQQQAEYARVQYKGGELLADRVVNCGGLYSDHVARRAGIMPKTRIIPFRGEYFLLRPEAAHLVRNLIYPVPDPRFPFLGVHFTRTIHGDVECGPNAVLAFAREGYSKRDFNPRDLWEILSYPGFLRMSAKYWKPGAAELWRSISKSAFLKSLQRLVPEVRYDDLAPAPAGVRAQALNSDGTLVDDFIIQTDRRIVHVLNAPSPAATSALSIGETIVAHFAQGPTGMVFQ